MFSFGSSSGLCYLGLPKKYSGVEFSISSYDDFFLLLFDICRYNLSLGSNMVCLDINDLDLDDSFFNDVLEEENKEISTKISELNSLINSNHIRVCFFLGKDFFLGSQISGVFEKTVDLLDRLSNILDSIGVKTPSIVTRIGSAYGHRKNTMNQFCERVMNLDGKIREKLCVTNDDKPSLFSVTDLLSGVYYKCGIPICLRSLPHYFNDGGLSLREALFLSCSTWKEGQNPIYFYSESCSKDEFGLPVEIETSKFLSTRIPTFGLQCDIVIDCQERDFGLVKYLSELPTLPPLVIDRIGG